ncbi:MULTISPECIES: hypothetical protein [Nostoc]|uniref:CpcD n=2 Tax=Nostoc TaxID=1177 RepID=A0ABR8IL16_9NOSO|nr:MULTISPECIES: hypothetical protein [Nostoc]MBD2565680.1 hypothetical protein [Nostoc linckia FACHB-391]MBD2651883.1 hypothetical protein [Nostoc foliaceum FACHB-393]
MFAGDERSSDTEQPVVDIALKAKRSQSIFSITAESSADVDYWSHERGVGGQSGVKIRFRSFCVRKAPAKGRLKTRAYVKKLGCNSSAERYKLQDYTTGMVTCT